MTKHRERITGPFILISSRNVSTAYIRTKRTTSTYGKYSENPRLLHPSTRRTSADSSPMPMNSTGTSHDRSRYHRLHPHLPADTPEMEIIQGNIRVIRFPAWGTDTQLSAPITLSEILPHAFLLRRKDRISSSPGRGSSLPPPRARTRKYEAFLWSISSTDRTMRASTAAKTFLGKCYDHVFGWMVLRFADRVIANSQASASFVKNFPDKMLRSSTGNQNPNHRAMRSLIKNG